VSEVANASLSLNKGGGLINDEPLPKEVHTLMAKFYHNGTYRNPAVSFTSQFVSYIQNGLTELDDCLLKYNSPVYKTCPLKRRSYKNGRTEVVENKKHPAFEKMGLVDQSNPFQSGLCKYQNRLPLERSLPSRRKNL
jgi:hypothetical protein